MLRLLQESYLDAVRHLGDKKKTDADSYLESIEWGNVQLILHIMVHELFTTPGRVELYRTYMDEQTYVTYDGEVMGMTHAADKLISDYGSFHQEFRVHFQATAKSNQIPVDLPFPASGPFNQQGKRVRNPLDYEKIESRVRSLLQEEITKRLTTAQQSEQSEAPRRKARGLPAFLRQVRE